MNKTNPFSKISLNQIVIFLLFIVLSISLIAWVFVTNSQIVVTEVQQNVEIERFFIDSTEETNLIPRDSGPCVGQDDGTIMSHSDGTVMQDLLYRPQCEIIITEEIIIEPDSD